MSKRLKGTAGFTLIEILIVIIVLGILAMIIVPQITVSTDEAKVSTLQTDLSSLRSSIETYYAQHSNKYPGQTTTAGATNAAEAAAATAMVAQLTLYTSSSGATSSAKNTTYQYGPYIRGTALPTNPFNSKSDVVCDDTVSIDKARTASGTRGWRYHFNTGVIYANDSSTHASY